MLVYRRRSSWSLRIYRSLLLDTGDAEHPTPPDSGRLWSIQCRAKRCLSFAELSPCHSLAAAREKRK